MTFATETSHQKIGIAEVKYKPSSLQGMTGTYSCNKKKTAFYALARHFKVSTN